jgi:DNA-binding response OmpR family regulator
MVPASAPDGAPALVLHVVGAAAFAQALAAAERAFVRSALLSLLAERKGRIVAYRELVDGIYGHAAGPDDPLDTFRVIAHRLRKRGVPIIAHKGRGYSYRAPSATPAPTR